MSDAESDTTARRVAYARELDQLAADRRAEASRLRAIIRATEAEADRIEKQARDIMKEVTDAN